MTANWEPLGAREGRQPGGFREGVPAGLREHLRQWIETTICGHVHDVDRLMIRLDHTLPMNRAIEHQAACMAYQRDLKNAAAAAEQAQPGSSRALALRLAQQTIRPPANPRARFLARDTPTDGLFDVIDAILNFVPYKPPTPASADPVARVIAGAWRAFRTTDPREKLQQLLLDARSVYTIRADGFGLERRVSATTAASTALAAKSAQDSGHPNAALRLGRAWQKTYSLHPDPSDAYREAILAAEAAANPFFLPADPQPTLGKVLAHLQDAAAKYQLTIPAQTGEPANVDTLTHMIRTLWEGHRDRHEGGPSTTPITQQAAEAALSLASIIVHWITTGAVQRKT